MTLTPDILYERNILRNSLRKWKFVTALAVSAAVFLVVGDEEMKTPVTDYIAKVTIDGVLFEDDYRAEKIEKLASSDRVKAVIVKINSPGGVSYAGEQLYRNLRKVAAKKPVVAVLGTVAASAAYMTAIGADYIVSGDLTITGSIGVLMEYFDFTGILQKYNIDPVRVKSTALKASPSPIEKMTPEAKAAALEIINDQFANFKEIVQARRKLTDLELKTVSDGRAFTGRQALKQKLVDQIGNEDTALEWLEKEKKIKENLAIKEIDIVQKRRLEDFFAATSTLKNIVSKIALWF